MKTMVLRESTILWSSRPMQILALCAILLSAGGKAANSGNPLKRSESLHSSRPLDCSLPLELGASRYDLSSLKETATASASYDTPPSTTIYTLLVNLCTNLRDTSGGSDSERCPANARVCQKVASRPRQSSGDAIVHQVIPLSTDAYGFEVELGDRDGPSGERNLDFTLHGPEYAGKSQKMKLELICSKTKGLAPEFRGYDLLEGKAKVKWSTPAACPMDAPPTDSGKGGQGSTGSDTAGSSSSGWGFFSWFFFLFIFGIVAYFIVGTYLNQQRYGVMEIPHRDFWREAPYLVQDAGRHAWKSISGQGHGVSGRSGGYEAL